MHDVLDIIRNVQNLYAVGPTLGILKDFERVLDELDLYVYDNWKDGELAEGPNIERHWISCKFFWPREKMPDPMGGKRLLDYDCKIKYQKSYLIEPRKIRKPDDIRPGTKKGKLDRKPIWIVEIMMPKKLVADIYGTYSQMKDLVAEPAQQTQQPQAATQEADVAAAPGAGATAWPRAAWPRATCHTWP